jgi:dienelactone hydrolase
VAGARGRSARTAIIVYPNAYHDFDQPNLPLQVRSGVAFRSGTSGKVHVGTDPAARVDAIKRTAQWILR